MNTDKFLELYKRLEINVRSVYNLDNSESVSYFLSHNNEFVKYENEIRYMSDIRNLLMHNPKINGTYAIDVSDETIDFLNKLIGKINKRQKLKDIMVPVSKVYFAYPKSRVVEVIANLSDKLYNHVPIKDGSKIIGVFDETTLFNLIRDKVVINSNLTFEDIRKYIEIQSENRQVYLFAKENDYVDVLEEQFNELYKQGKRVGLVFVKGKYDDIVGIISTTDLLGR